VVFIESLLSTIKDVNNAGILLDLDHELESNFSFELSELFGVDFIFQAGIALALTVARVSKGIEEQGR
jgi:hypothetical protein